MTRMGPNDARHVVWAILGEFFLKSFLRVFITYVLSNYRCYLQTTEARRSAMTGLGPNDVPCVVWAFFFSLDSAHTAMSRSIKRTRTTI